MFVFHFVGIRLAFSLVHDHSLKKKKKKKRKKKKKSETENMK